MHLCFAALTSLALTVDAPVSAVTVYSDRARVTRTASLELTGTEKVELPLLLETADPGSIRIEAQGAEVKRVDIAHVDESAFPRDEAKALLRKIEAVQDETSLLTTQRAAYAAQLGALDRLGPKASAGDPLKPAPKLNASGWGAALAWVASSRDKLQTRAREADNRLLDLGREAERLAEQARLLGGAGRRSGYRVTATVAGKGPARVQLSYLVQSARWYPTYDLALDPARSEVRVAFAGLVSQESGEDWENAALTLSTAVPATAVKFPKLLTWKIGERDRFIPTPVAAPEPQPPPPPQPANPLAHERDEDARLRAELGQAAGRLAGADRDGDGIPDAMDQCPDQPGAAEAGGCPSAKYQVVTKAPSTGEYEYRRRGDLERAKQEEARRYAEDKKVAEEYPKPMPPPEEKPAPAPAMPEAAPQADREETVTVARAPGAILSGLFGGSKNETPPEPQPTSELGIAPPPGYRPPGYAPDSPAALAGGYDLAYLAPRPESIKSGGGARRVPLFAQSWPVQVERKLYPALRQEAFLTAELKNPANGPLPGGQANLAVGADPAGVARLSLVAPGETFTLPLGLDRAVKPVRNVEVSQAEKGFIGKDDVTQYRVVTEVANPYPVPISIRVFDQWPLSNDEHVKISLDRTEPYALQDRDKGTLEWRVQVPARGKSQVSFTYTVRRPKGWRLHQ